MLVVLAYPYMNPVRRADEMFGNRQYAYIKIACAYQVYIIKNLA